MWIKVAVAGAEARRAEHAVDATEEGELASAVAAAVKDYRRLYPDAPSFDYRIEVSRD